MALFQFMFIFFLFNTFNHVHSTLLETTNGVFYLSGNDTKYEGLVKGFKIFCKKPVAKGINKIWKTTYLEINSSSDCTTYEASKPDEFANMTQSNTYAYYSQKLISKVLNWMILKSTSEQSCHQIIYVPTFKTYCVGVQTTGELKVTINYENHNTMLIAFFVAGIILYYLARPLSKSVYFHYSSGILLGTIGSLLILFIIAFKYIPKKGTAIITIVSGGSLVALTLRWIWLQFKPLAESLQTYLIYYIILSAIISWAYCYYRGPITNQRALNLLEYLLKGFAIFLIYIGTSLKEISILTVTLMFSIHYLSKVLNSKLISSISYKLFPPKRRLLTSDEYAREAQEYTAKALAELKEFCKSPDCNSWRVMSRLKQPDRFARFVETNEPHVTENELSAYENEMINNDLMDDDLDYYEESCVSNNSYR